MSPEYFIPALISGTALIVLAACILFFVIENRPRHDWRAYRGDDGE